MRWTKEPTPVEGDLRVIEFFAWFPVTIGLETRWLEWVTVQQRYCKITEFSSDIHDSWQRDYFEWLNLHFIDKEIDIYYP